MKIAIKILGTLLMCALTAIASKFGAWVWNTFLEDSVNNMIDDYKRKNGKKRIVGYV